MNTGGFCIHFLCSVRNGCAEVGKVDRRAADLALSDGQRDDGCGFPATLTIISVVVFRIRNESSEFGREVAAQLLSESETHHIFPPFVQSIVDTIIFRVFKDGTQHITVICVA